MSARLTEGQCELARAYHDLEGAEARHKCRERGVWRSWWCGARPDKGTRQRESEARHTVSTQMKEKCGTMTLESPSHLYRRAQRWDKAKGTCPAPCLEKQLQRPSILVFYSSNYGSYFHISFSFRISLEGRLAMPRFSGQNRTGGYRFQRYSFNRDNISMLMRTCDRRQGDFHSPANLLYSSGVPLNAS